MVRAEDALEDELIDDDEGVVENEEDTGEVDGGEDLPTTTDMEDEAEEEKPLKPSPDASTRLLFTKPSSPHELPAAQEVKLLVGFHNKGDKDFIIDGLEGSFRYPQDFNYYLQNFTDARFDKTVTPNQEVTLYYTFTPSEMFSARPLGLSILLHYKDTDNNLYMDALFNDTITISEPDEGLDGETFFLYVLMAAVLVLIVVAAHHLLTHKKIRSKIMKSKPRPQLETGTQNTGDVDLDWLPMEHINNSSPGRSPSSRKEKRSPQNRRRRNRGGAED